MAKISPDDLFHILMTLASVLITLLLELWNSMLFTGRPYWCSLTSLGAVARRSNNMQ